MVDIEKAKRNALNALKLAIEDNIESSIVYWADASIYWIRRSQGYDIAEIMKRRREGKL